MKQYNSFNLVCILLLILLTVQLSKNASLDIRDRYKKFTGDQGLYTQKDDVEILTADNFKEAIVGSRRAWLVEFYNSWCGFCQRFAPSWKEFAKDVRGWRDVVVVAAVDCANDHNYALCRDYEVMSYPSLRYYHEGFQEEQKKYGFAMNRGVTANDHRQDLVSKIISEQNEGRGKHFPHMIPYNKTNIDDIFNEASSDAEYAVFIIHEPGSLLGPEILLDLHKASKVIARYAHSNNTKLVSSLPEGTLPNLFIIGRDKHATPLMPNTRDRAGMLEAIKEELKGKGIIITIDEEGSDSGIDPYEKKQDVDVLMEKVKEMEDVVFQMDLETALRYSLKREVGGSKEITAEKLSALRKYLRVLATYFPFGRNGKLLLQEISAYAESDDIIQGAHIGRLVKNAENADRLVFSTPQKWLGCQGSSPQFRGYPCGLWKMFHYLTINVADLGLGGDNPRLALEAMHGYIKHFFGCADCSQHFQQMAARREIDKVSSFNESILWLWMAHNEVNKRLSGDETEDPEFPKIQFPPEKRCPKCHTSNGDWNHTEVLKYLKNMYNSLNIKYLGADTKVIYLGLDGNYTIAHEGLQEEDVQVQTRSAWKGLTNGTDSDGSSLGATTKDKANLMLLFLLVLTVLYVKRSLVAN